MILVISNHLVSSQDQSTHEVLAEPADWCHKFSNSCPLNLSRSSLALAQQQDKFLGSLYQYVPTNLDKSVLKDLSKKERNWVMNTAPCCTVVDGLLVYSDEFMNNPSHPRIFVPSDTQLQRRLLQAYHDSPMSMRRGRDATYLSLVQDFYWRNGIRTKAPRTKTPGYNPPTKTPKPKTPRTNFVNDKTFLP